MVHSRAEAKKKRSEARVRQSSKSGGSSHAPAPGARIGVEAEKTAFWLMMQEHFRDIAVEDIAMLMPAFPDPSKDPVFFMPPIPAQKPGEVPPKRQRKQPAKRRLPPPNPETTVTDVSAVAGEDEGELCAVCFIGESSEENQIVFCDICNVGVHQMCYGVPEIPSGPWNCAACLHKKETGREPACAICPVRGGALKPCAPENGRVEPEWVHLFCSQWTPETYVDKANLERMEPVEGLPGISKSRRGLPCAVCNERHGSCIQCSASQCRAAFHPMCARNAGHRMKVSVCRGSGRLDMKAFCARHSAKGRQDGRCVSGSEAEDPAGDAAAELPGQEWVPEPRGDLQSSVDSDLNMHPDRTPLLKQCTGQELAMLALSMNSVCAVSLGDSSELLGACGAASEEEAVARLREVASTAGPSLPQSAVEALRGWIASRASGLLRPESPGDGPEAAAGAAASSAAPQVEGAAVPSSLSSGGGGGGQLRALPDPHLPSADAPAADPPGARPETPSRQLPEAPLSPRISLSKGIGLWGRLDIPGPGAWAAEASLGAAEAVPSSTLSLATKLQRLAAELAGGEPRPTSDSLHPYTRRLLEASPPLLSSTIGRSPGALEASGTGADLVAAGLSVLAVGADKAEPGTPVPEPAGSCEGGAKGGLPAPETVSGLEPTEAAPVEHPERESGVAPDSSQVLRSVWECISRGTDEGASWEPPVESVREMLADAPDDEVAGEILALQSELLQQMVINRRRTTKLLQKALQSIPQQLEESTWQAKAERDMDQCLERLKELRRQAKLERKQQQLREQQAALEAAAAASPRSMVSLRGARHGDPPGSGGEKDPSSLGPHDLLDPLAARKIDDDAACVICGEGHSEAPNVIVFCERCDIGVHQQCYGVDEIPSGEWLCWPCQKHEDELEARGFHRSQIRAPRWQRKSRLSGGSTDTRCALCPNKLGAFRRTADGQKWVHEVCALWHPEVRTKPSLGPDVFTGLDAIPPARWRTKCSVCGGTTGAVVPCAAGQGACRASFHPLCARRAGLPLVSSGDAHAVFCALHRDMAPGWTPEQPPRPDAAPQPAKAEAGPSGAAPQAKTPASSSKAKAPAVAHAAVTPKPPPAPQRKRRQSGTRLSALEKDFDTLQRARVEMEQLRLLCSCVTKRERGKRLVARLLRDLEGARRAAASGQEASALLQQMASGIACAQTASRPSQVGHSRRRSSSDDGHGPSKRVRHYGRGEPAGQAAHGDSPPPWHGFGHAPHQPKVRVDRERIMTPDEAEAFNGRLPPGFLYVPTDAFLDNSQHNPGK